MLRCSCTNKRVSVSVAQLSRAEGDVFLLSGLWEGFLHNSMSHSLCLVRPNTPEADHSLTAYKLKQIALSMLYYLLLLTAVSNFRLRGGAYFTEANDQSVDLVRMLRAEDE